ncbi:MAG: COX15/CtaA family protein, partial [Candidatus Poseidoniia archaeon]|nr:COX15/CtaA family protein [Candidatus Poseidoniia archaeon]
MGPAKIIACSRLYHSRQGDYRVNYLGKASGGLPWNHRLPLALAALALLIIITGGWVRIVDAGESCPDWPACFGGWQFDVPPG